MNLVQHHTQPISQQSIACLCALLWMGASGSFVQAGDTASTERTSRISDRAVVVIDPKSIPTRPKPILELGNPFLGTGNIDPGFKMPGGAIWQPAVIVFGTLRTAVASFDDGDETRSEWANRLDLFANLQLTGTERILAGVRVLDEDGQFTGYNFTDSGVRGGSRGPGGQDEGWQDNVNIELTTLFFEGDFGQLFPDLDPLGTRQLDWGFSIGRQPLFYQDGMLINDTVDAIGITRNTLLADGVSNLQITFLYGYNELDRNDNLEHDASLLGLFTAWDLPDQTIYGDVVYVMDDDQGNDGLYWGINSVQRIGHLNTSFRVLGSQALGRETAAVSSGHLLFTQVSWTPPWTHDNAYVNLFWGIDQFASAARSADAGGPLGEVGILFAAVGLGRYGAPLGNGANDAMGAAIGYQVFLDSAKRQQCVVELGARQSTLDGGDGMMALAGRYQQAFGQHTVLQLDLFGSLQESGNAGHGFRCELRFEF